MNLDLPKNLHQIILALQHESKVDNPMVAQIVANYPLSSKDIAAFNLFTHQQNESYGRQLIFDNGNFKILLMSWRKDDFTAIHNHGFTEWGCVYSFGEATHRLYEVENDKLKLVQNDNFHAGQVASVCGNLTHMMGNVSNDNFATLHIYGSNSRNQNVSENAKVYLPEEQKIVTTMGEAFLHMDKGFVISENPLCKISNDVLLDYYSLVKPFYERNRLMNKIQKMDEILLNS